jgi:recombination protein RecA
LPEQLPTGRLIEITDGGRAGAQMTLAVACLRQAQLLGETAAWVQPEGGTLYPPDLADSGIDLDALVIVNVPASRTPSRPAPTRERQRDGKRGGKQGAGFGLARAAELLLRSGGFGMVLIDLQGAQLPPGGAWQGRLLGLAREHAARVILLGDCGGPLVGLSLSPSRERIGRGLFSIETHVRKDKSGLLSPPGAERRRGPWGLL